MNTMTFELATELKFEQRLTASEMGKYVREMEEPADCDLCGGKVHGRDGRGPCPQEG